MILTSPWTKLILAQNPPYFRPLFAQNSSLSTSRPKPILTLFSTSLFSFFFKIIQNKSNIACVLHGFKSSIVYTIASGFFAIIAFRFSPHTNLVLASQILPFFTSFPLHPNLSPPQNFLPHIPLLIRLQINLDLIFSGRYVGIWRQYLMTLIRVLSSRRWHAMAIACQMNLQSGPHMLYPPTCIFWLLTSSRLPVLNFTALGFSAKW